MNNEETIMDIATKPGGGMYKYVMACVECGTVFGSDNKEWVCKECFEKHLKDWQLEFDFDE